jgi:hypothetical protein
MPEVTNERLTERERACMEHFRKAQERGESFAEYCRSNGLNANEWHAVKHGMMLKGLLPPGKGPAKKRSKIRRPKKKRSGFVSVQVARSASPSPLGTPVCRVRHPSGCVIECASFPEAQWLAALMAGEPA